jgi:Ca-activated chloride channel family protein
MFRFADPYYFLLLLPVGLAAWRVFGTRRRTGILFAATRRLPGGRRSWRVYAVHACSVTALLGLVLGVFALARPQTVFSQSKRSSDVIAVEMVVDVSGSMEALDLSINTPAGKKYQTRLDVVKKTFADFVSERKGDLIGLVTFAGYATTRAPLTTDTGALLHVLKGVEIPKPARGKNGQILDEDELMTAIGDALVTACARIKDTDAKSKVIVLLSDGESNTGIIKPDAAIRTAEELGIKVYTIGIGTRGRAPFRTRDVFGRDTIQYGVVSLDERLLRDIAEKTGGQYFNVRDPKGLAKAMASIDELETTRIEEDIYNQYNELFPRFLVPALGLMVLGTGLNMLIARRII